MPAVEQVEKVVFTSFDPADAVRGGLISDVDVVIKDIQWTLEGPEGYQSREPNYFLHGWLALIEDLNVVEEVWWSAGAQKLHTPCDDEGEPLAEGYRLTGGPMIQGSNALAFLASLKDCGIDASPGSHRIASGDLRQLVGVEMHIVRKVIERSGLQRAPREDGRTEAGTVICQKIIRVPGEKRAAKGKPAAAAAKPAAAATAKPVAAKSAAAAAAKPAPVAPVAQAAEPETVPANAPLEPDVLANVVLSELMGASMNGLPIDQAKVGANRILYAQYQLSMADRNKVIAVMLSPEWLGQQGIVIEEEMLRIAT